MKLTLVNPANGNVATFERGDREAPALFHEYVVDGWVPCGETEERLAREILRVEALKKEASHVRKD